MNNKNKYDSFEIIINEKEDKKILKNALKKNIPIYKNNINRKIKIKQNIKIKSIDLHGCNSNEAEFRVKSMLKSEHFTNTEKLIFICGKGKHSDGEPVLQGIVENILNNSKDFYIDYIKDNNGNYHVHLR